MDIGLAICIFNKECRKYLNAIRTGEAGLIESSAYKLVDENIKMKYTFTLLACIAFSIQFSKAQRTDSTQLKLTYGSEISEINALFNLEHVDYFKITSRDTSLKNQYFSFTTKEYWDKNLVKIDTLLSGAGAESISYGKNDTSLVFSLMTKAKNNDTIDFSYNLFKYGTLRPYKKLKSTSR